MVIDLVTLEPTNQFSANKTLGFSHVARHIAGEQPERCKTVAGVSLKRQ